VFAFPNMFHFFAHELARLRGRRFAFAFVFVRPFDCVFFWHNKVASPLAAGLDVTMRFSGYPCARKERIVILQLGSADSAHAYNSDNYFDSSLNRRLAGMAV
jgi:hypothetical protein